MGYRVSPTLSTVQARLLTSMLHATRWPPGRGISPHINRKGTSDHFIAHRGAALEVVGVLQRPSKMPDAASSRATPLKRDEAAHLYTLASQLPMDELDAAFLPPRPEPCMRVLLADLFVRLLDAHANLLPSKAAGPVRTWQWEGNSSSELEWGTSMQFNRGGFVQC